MSTVNRCYRLRSFPEGKITKDDLELVEEAFPECQDGQVIVKNTFASIDPTHRIWMSGKKAQYMDPVEIGDIMRAATVGVIVVSKHPEWQVGTHVMGFGGLCDYFVGIPEKTCFIRASVIRQMNRFLRLSIFRMLPSLLDSRRGMLPIRSSNLDRMTLSS